MYSNIEASRFRRAVALIGALVLMAVGLLAVPASADAPIVFSTSQTIVDVNPCTGELNEITLNTDFRVHEHRNNVVGHISRSGETDSGYVLTNGVESFVENHNVVRAMFSDQWRHADGSMFRAAGHFTVNFNTGEVVVDQLTVRCLGG